MTIPEETIKQHLEHLLSTPGGSLHHLLVTASHPTTTGPLGTPTLETAVYAIVPDNSAFSTDEWVTRVVLAAGVDHAKRGMTIQFAALSQEMWGVDPMDDRGRQLQKQGKPDEHPRAAELTVVYAAGRDGRRWFGMRWLTGPKAGQIEQTYEMTGNLTARDWAIQAAVAVRRIVRPN